jgi:predicted RNase H-like nuclease (RuvC/YqgF family)
MAAMSDDYAVGLASEVAVARIRMRDLEAEVEHLRSENAELAESHGFMATQFEIMRREKEHGWREAERWEAEVEHLRAELARRDEQITAVRALAAKWWGDPRHGGDGDDILDALGVDALSVDEIAGLYSGQEVAKEDYR